MEVILLTDVEKIGKEGDIVNVRDGYGRNYLLPRKLAVISSPHAVKLVESKKRKRETEKEKVKEEALKTSKKIENLSCTISVEAGLEDKIFGTVTPEMIRNSLRQENFDIDKRDIIIEEPIKKLGVYQVKIKLHPEVDAKFRIWIVKK